MAANWRQGTVSELQAEGILLVEDGNHGESRPRHEEFTNTGVAFIRAADMENGTVLFEAASKINETARRRITKGIGAPGDVLLSHKGTVGKVALVPDDAPSFVCSPQTTLWRSRMPDALDRGYLFAFLRSPTFHAQLASRSGETDMAPYVSLTAQRTLLVDLPPIDHQRAIAHILGTLDNKIELNRRTNETLEAMARALFKSWFVDFDPVRAKAAGKQPAGMDAETAALFPSEFVASEVGEIPKGWSSTTLGKEVARCDGTIQTGPFGSQLHASDYLPVGVPVVMPKDISRRRVSTTTIARVSEQDAERLSRHRLEPGDVIYSRRGDVERHAMISEREAGWLCGTGCLLVRLGSKWPSPMFASFALDRPETRAWITQHAIGATMPNLNTGILSSVPIVMPPDQVLRAFGLAVDQVQGLVVSRYAEIGMLAQTRDALLPRLLSGELRIPDAERIASAAT